MKFIILTLFFSKNIIANDDYKLTCYGNRGKINLTIQRIENKLNFSYKNTEGNKDFPFYEGVVTSETIPFLKAAKNDLKIINDILIYEWNIDNCKKNNEDPRLVSCEGESILKQPEKLKIKSFDFFTNIVSEKNNLFSYEIFKVKIGLDINSSHYLISMPFDPAQCSIENPNNFYKR